MKAPRAGVGSLAHRLPGLSGLLADRDRWRREALRRRGGGARLQARLDGATSGAAAARAEAAAAHAHYAWLRREVGSWLPGHYYSPIPDRAELRARDEQVWRVPETVPGVDFRADAQLAHLPAFAELYRECPFPDEPTPEFRYAFHNRFFAHPDGLAYYCLLRTWQPARVLEIGSGWSSGLLLDTVERFAEHPVELTFVEPFTERLDELLRSSDSGAVTVLREPLHAVADTVFDLLRPGDVLFIDSTHVSKIGSDVNRLLLEVLPTLPAGVHVHLHDVFYPFEYPREWVYDGRSWNEAYLLRALLVDNPTLQIEWSNSYLKHFHSDQVTAAMPKWAIGHGGSIWLTTLPGPARRR